MAVLLHKEKIKTPILGELVSWSIGSFSRDINSFIDSYKTLDLPDHCIARRQARSILRKTLKELEKEGHIIKVSETENKISYRIFKEVKRFSDELNEYDLDLVKADRFTYNKNSRVIDSKTASSQVLEKLNQLFLFYESKITGPELSATLIRVLYSAGSLSLTTRGGIYFIPFSRLEIVDKLETLVKDSGVSFLRLGVIDSIKYKKELKDLAVKEILGETREIKKEIKRLEANPEKAKAYVVKNRVIRLKRISEKVTAIQEAGIDVDVEKSIRICRRQLKRLLKT